MGSKTPSSSSFVEREEIGMTKKEVERFIDFDSKDSTGIACI
jgi:hypothetical protein